MLDSPARFEFPRKVFRYVKSNIHTTMASNLAHTMQPESSHRISRAAAFMHSAVAE